MIVRKSLEIIKKKYLTEPWRYVDLFQYFNIKKNVAIFIKPSKQTDMGFVDHIHSKVISGFGTLDVRNILLPRPRKGWKISFKSNSLQNPFGKTVVFFVF